MYILLHTIFSSLHLSQGWLSRLSVIVGCIHTHTQTHTHTDTDTHTHTHQHTPTHNHPIHTHTHTHTHDTEKLSDGSVNNRRDRNTASKTHTPNKRTTAVTHTHTHTQGRFQVMGFKILPKKEDTTPHHPTRPCCGELGLGGSVCVCRT